MTSSHSANRRTFLKQAAVTALTAPTFIRGLMAAPPSDVVRHASIGASGMAGADLGAIASHPKVKLVCVADVDLAKAETLKQRFPDIRIYQDWRQLLDKEQKNLDSINVSTPDHMHAPIGMSAMQLGLHVYGQKPLTHDVYESRQLARVAAEKKLVTQMGIQIHSSSEYRTAVALIQSGAIGKVKEVHSWSSKKWGDSSPLPDRADPIPEKFDWDMWLGVCAERPFIGGGYYHPGNWRKRLDFGTGTFGDMGCHIFDPVFKAMDLTAPLTAHSLGPAPSPTNWANDAKVLFTFPETKYSVGPTFPINWYDGDQRPAKEVTSPWLGDKPLPDQGSLFIGEKGALLLPHVAQPILLPEAQYEGFERPKIAGDNHWHQFVEAILGNGRTLADFSYAGPLTESVLLGGVATFFPDRTLEWDAAGLQFKGLPEADRLIRRQYRAGWEVTGLSGVGPFTSSEEPKVTLKKDDRIVFLGDSITQGGDSHDKGYVRIIRRTLREKHPDLTLEVIGAGISGNKIPDLQNRLERDVLSKKPTIVVIYIGINDVWHGQNDPARGTMPDAFQAGLKDVIGKCVAAGSQVVLCTPSVIGEKNEGANPLDPKLDQHSDISRGIAKELRLPLCDLRHAFQAYLKENNKEEKNSGVLTGDGVHLNDAGNQFVADTMLKVIDG